MRKFVSALFFGNFFYGICAVALCIETNLQLHLPINNFLFYLVIFLCTICFYGFIYFKSKSANNPDERTFWYKKNNRLVKVLLLFFSILIVVSISIWLLQFNIRVSAISWKQILLACTFPLAAIFYISAIFPFPFLQKIRRIGWLKPFIVGFAWSGIVSIYPVLFIKIRMPETAINEWITFLFWLQNFIFISLLAIIFDIKDYKTDLHFNLLTYPARLGIKKTFLKIILPLAIISLSVLLIFLQYQQATILQMLIQIIPFILLLILCINFKKLADVLFYLVAVDGLMLAKAICGILSILIFS